MLTCTWAPTAFEGPKVAQSNLREPRQMPKGPELRDLIQRFSDRIESLGLSHLLIAQRWWGSGLEIEGSTLDCTAMTSLFAAYTKSTNLVTAIHPGFFHPGTLAKWAATIDQISGGRWAINVTSGWNLQEFDMYGVSRLEHDERYDRSKEFIEILKTVWSDSPVSYQGKYFEINELQLEPRPTSPLTIFQGGQSEAAIDMAASHSDWMFLNGGSLEKITTLIAKVRKKADCHNRKIRFALYANPLCRRSDKEAWSEIKERINSIDPDLRAKRQLTTSGAQGMWANDDDLSYLDTNEGYSSRLIGSPETIIDRVEEFRVAGVDMLHVTLGDTLFEKAVLPQVIAS